MVRAQAASTRLQVSANNVANVLSTGTLPDEQGNYTDQYLYDGDWE